MGTKGTFDEVTEADMSNLATTDGGIAVYDDTRGKWMSASKTYFEFARKGVSKGMYLNTLGELDDADDGFTPGKNAVIVSVFCRSKSGNKSQDFEIHKNGVSIFSFSYDGVTRRYTNKDLSLDISATDTIQVYTKVPGTGTRNCFCRLEVGWKYDI